MFKNKSPCTSQYTGFFILPIKELNRDDVFFL